MAYRQYIGARYVPLYDGHWNGTKNYEPLTIVDDANGNSYTSKKDVPAGTPLNNKEYWIQTSSFSGAITQLQNRVSDVENRVSDVENRVSDVENGIDDLNIWRASVEEQKCAIFIGDSYSVGSGYNAALAESLGYAADRRAVFDASGYGFTDINPSGGKWLDLVQNNLSRITFDYERVDLIVISGGLNDVSNTTDAPILTAMEEMINWLKTTFPNAAIKIAMIGVQMKVTTTAELSIYSKIYSMLLPAYKKCNQYGAEYLDGTEWILFNRARLQDNENHPLSNAEQRDWIASNLRSAVLHGQVEVKEGCQVTFIDGSADLVTPATLAGYVERVNGSFAFYNNSNIAGLTQILENTATVHAANATFDFIGAIVSNADCAVLPPRTGNNYSHYDTTVMRGTVFRDATTTSMGSTFAEVYPQTNVNDKKLRLSFSVASGALVTSGTYKIGIGGYMPVRLPIWNQ